MGKREHDRWAATFWRFLACLARRRERRRLAQQRQQERALLKQKREESEREIADRVASWRRQGRSWRAIFNTLVRSGERRESGKLWSVGALRRLVARQSGHLSAKEVVEIQEMKNPT